jgi:hypothetical protein
LRKNFFSMSLSGSAAPPNGTHDAETIAKAG